MAGWYRIGEFAKLTGVSIRTLHYYDEIGLLRPAGFSEGGHRLYDHNCLVRLQQILTLKYLQFPLGTIGELLDRPDFDVNASLRIQGHVLRERIAELEQAEATLEALLAGMQATPDWDWNLATDAIAAIQRGAIRKDAAVEQYYTPEQMQRFAELKEQISDKEIEAIEQEWSVLLTEVRANRDLDPTSAEARALAERWNVLTEQTRSGYEGYDDLWDAVGENYEQGKFADHPNAPSAEDFAFIQKINANNA